MTHTMTKRRRRWIVAPLLTALLGAPAVACSGDDSKASIPEVTEAPTTTDPTDVDDPTKMAFTNTIKIVDGSVQPLEAHSAIGAPIEFANTTAVPQEIRFTNGSPDGVLTGSGVIAPGATWSWTQPGDLSITYEVVTQPGVAGHIQAALGVE